MISVEALGKQFHIRNLPNGTDNQQGEIWAVRELSFQLHQGKVLGLIGPNGAGKSTLLKILSGIYLPTSGRAKLNGRTGAVLDIGSGFHPDLTGKENIYFAGRLAGMSKTQLNAVYPEIVAFSELEQHLHTPVKYYSSGMFLRLAFSTLIHTDCDIFLFDEVLAVGDSAFQEKCFQRIQSLKQAGKTMIMASHEPAKLAQFCDEVMVMAEGKSQFIGPPHAALAFYSKHYSAEMRLDLANSLYLSNLEFLGASTISSKGDQLCSVKIVLELKSIAEDTIIALSLTDSLNQLLFSGHHSISMNLMPGKPLEIEWQFSKNILNEGLFWVNLYLMKGGSLEEQFPKIGKLEVPPLQDPIRQIEAGFHALHIDSQISIKTT